MSNIDEIIAGITVDSAGEEEAEWAFGQRLDDLLEEPRKVRVVGRELMCESSEQTPGRSRVRAVVTDGDEKWRVNLDALRFESGTAHDTVVRAYRHWLGYPVDSIDVSHEETSRAVSREQLDARLAELEHYIDDALTTLEQLDLGELESWLGDDDPWGHNEQYWPGGMYVYRDQTNRLADLAVDVGRLVDAGVYEESRRLVETILFGLEGLVYDYFCPDEARHPAREAVKQWLRCLNAVDESQFDPGRSATNLVRWLEFFELYLRRELIVSRLPEAMNAPFIDKLETFIASDDEEYRRPSLQRGALRLLTELRRKRGEVSLLWERLSLKVLDEETVDVVARWCAEQGDISRAIEIVDIWLHHAHSSSSRVMTRQIEKRRRKLLSSAGREEEAIDQLWNSFDDYPTTQKLEELLELAPSEVRDEFRDRAVERVEDPAVLVDMAAEFAPWDSLVERIEQIEMDELREVSSWTLQEAAPSLESTWPAVAVQVYTALGWRHVDRGKPKYYDLSVEAFQEARDLYRQLGREDDWQRVVEEVTAEHGRKYTFMPRFEAIA